MARVRKLITAMNGGEVSPLIKNRPDIEKYDSCLSLCENFLPEVQGAVRRRGGFRYIGGSKNNGKVALVSFERSSDVKYILEFGHLYMRVWKDYSLVMSGGVPYEIVTPFTLSDLFDSDGRRKIYTAQSIDVLYIATGKSPMKLSHYAEDNWVLEYFEPSGGPWLDSNSDKNKLISASDRDGTGFWSVDGKILLTASWDFFTDDMLGMRIRLESTTFLEAPQWESEVKIAGKSLRRRSDGKTYLAVEAKDNDNWYTGSNTPIHTEGAVWDGDSEKNIQGDEAKENLGVKWQYEDSGYGIGTITEVIDSRHAYCVSDIDYPFPWGVVVPTIEAVEWKVSVNQSEKVAIWEWDYGTETFILVGYEIINKRNRELTVMAPQNLDEVGFIRIEVYHGRPKENNSYILSIGITNPITGVEYVFAEEEQVSRYQDRTERTYYGEELTEPFVKFPTGNVSFNAFYEKTATETHGAATWKWELSPWYDGGTYPTSVTLFRERLVWAGGLWVWFSVAGDFENFEDKTFGVTDISNGMSILVASDTANNINWLASGDYLIVGTSGGENIIKEITNGEPFGPGNYQQQAQSAYMSDAVRPITIGSSFIFVQKGGTRTLSMSYDYVSDKYVAPDTSILASHITNRQIIQTTFCSVPYSVFYCVDKSGNLVGSTYDKEQNVYAWHRHPIADGGYTVSCITSMPGLNNASTDLIASVYDVTANKYYICVLDIGHIWGRGIEDCFFVDLGITVINSPASETVSGLSHLEGKVVSILADGFIHRDLTVSDGSVTLDYPASKITVGLKYTSLIETLPIEKVSRYGSSSMSRKRPIVAVPHVVESAGLSIGSLESNLWAEKFSRTIKDNTGEKIVLETGALIDNPFRGSWGLEGKIAIKQDKPLPCEVTGITIDIDSTDMI